MRGYLQVDPVQMAANERAYLEEQARIEAGRIEYERARKGQWLVKFVPVAFVVVMLALIGLVAVLALAAAGILKP